MKSTSWAIDWHLARHLKVSGSWPKLVLKNGNFPTLDQAKMAVFRRNFDEFPRTVHVSVDYIRSKHTPCVHHGLRSLLINLLSFNRRFFGWKKIFRGEKRECSLHLFLFFPSYQCNKTQSSNGHILLHTLNTNRHEDKILVFYEFEKRAFSSRK